MTSYELTHCKKMVRVWKMKSLLFCLRYNPLMAFRRQNHITFIFIKTMSVTASWCKWPIALPIVNVHPFTSEVVFWAIEGFWACCLLFLCCHYSWFIKQEIQYIYYEITVGYTNRLCGPYFHKKMWPCTDVTCH